MMKIMMIMNNKVWAAPGSWAVSLIRNYFPQEEPGGRRIATPTRFQSAMYGNCSCFENCHRWPLGNMKKCHLIVVEEDASIRVSLLLEAAILEEPPLQIVIPKKTTPQKCILTCTDPQWSQDNYLPKWSCIWLRARPWLLHNYIGEEWTRTKSTTAGPK